MKKVLAFLLSLILVFTLVGCGGVGGNNYSSGNNYNGVGGNNYNSGNNSNNNNSNNSNNSNSGNSNSQNKTPPSINQVNNALHSNNYFTLRQEGNESDWSDIVTRGYSYEGARYFDEHGRAYAYNSSIDVESFANSNDYRYGDYLQYMYVECESSAAAQRAFNEMLDEIFDGKNYSCNFRIRGRQYFRYCRPYMLEAYCRA